MESNEDIMRAIGHLEGKVSEGFVGIHQRQDITNGRITKTEEKISSLEESRASNMGWNKRNDISRNIIWGLICSIISGGLALLAAYHML